MSTFSKGNKTLSMTLDNYAYNLQAKHYIAVFIFFSVNVSGYYIQINVTGVCSKFWECILQNPLQLAPAVIVTMQT